MTATPSNIQLGVCDVTYGGNDLGATKGGVQVKIETKTYEIKCDQTGDSPVKDVVIGTVVTIDVPMSETDLNKLKLVLPQGVFQTASGAAPTGFSLNNVAGYNAGATSVIVTAGTGTPVVGQTFTFANHTTVYRVVSWVSGTSTLTFCNHALNVGGLVAKVVNTEAMTFVARGAAIEIRTGVNIDLLNTFAAQLTLHPTGLALGTTDYDFVAYKAAPVPNYTFKYEVQGERVYNVSFKCYPDTANNSRIAVFGTPSP